MSNLRNKDITNVVMDGEIIKSISNISTDVILDTKEIKGRDKVSSEYFSDSSSYIILSDNEDFYFDIILEKNKILENEGFFKSGSNYFKISVLDNDGIYKTIYNFQHEADYENLQKYIEFSSTITENGLNTLITFEPYVILEALDKDYVFNVGDIKIEISDISGHLYTCTNRIPIFCFPFDLSTIVPLEITFENHVPSDRYIGKNSIGSVTAIIHNPDKNTSGYIPINVFLGDNSVGQIIKHKKLYFYYNEYGERVYVEKPSTIDDVRAETGNEELRKYEWLEIQIDNIFNTGYVQLYAHLLFNYDGYEEAIDYIKENVYKKSLSYATDGEWLTECPNNKKINLEPFVPMYLKESQYFEFVKFTEDFLNTMFYSNEANCKVGVLKKIEDLRSLHDIEEMDRVFFNDFSKHFGSNIKIDEKNLLKILTIFGDKSKTTYDENDLEKYIREAYRILPYYNRIKGTDESIKLILSTFGCTCEIIYKWLSKLDGDNKLYENIEDLSNKDSYYLSSHFNVDLGIKNYKIEEFIEIIEPVKELIVSIKPVSRILDAFEYNIEAFDYVTIDLSKGILCKKENNRNAKDNTYNVDVIKHENGSNFLYEIKFLNNLGDLGLDNFERFISNNGKKLIIGDTEITYKDLTYCDGYLYLYSDKSYDIDKDGGIKIRKLKDSLVYMNVK